MNDKEKQRERYLKWKMKHPHGNRDNTRRWRALNPERQRANARAYALRNIERVCESQKRSREKKSRRKLITKIVALLRYASNRSCYDSYFNSEAQRKLISARDSRRRHYERNKSKIINRARLHKKKMGNYYYHANINVKLKVRLRNRLRSALKNNQKSGATIEYLGCTVENLKKHLEAQFKSGMDWSNWRHDGWHIDHVRPLASFDLTDESQLRDACHYTNLQPLWWWENLKKRDNCVLTDSCTNSVTEYWE